MKLLTINTHSLIEDNYLEKCDIFADAINRINPDIIAMQEVNQSKKSKIIDELSGIREDNHALKISRKINNYHFSWINVKNGYEIFDEGLAIFSKKPIGDIKSLLLTNTDDYNNWKKRAAQIVKIEDFIVCNVHMGWWNDDSEPFFEQFKRLNSYLSPHNNTIFIMGDFNSPSDIKGEGYDMVISNGWYDTYTLAKTKDDGFTVTGNIAGWEQNRDNKRIDYIFTNKELEIKSSEVIFNGINEKIISDHNGVIINI